MRKEKEDGLRREIIIKAARSVFANNDYPTATIEMIAAKAEMARATLYKYYSTKDEIYSEVIAGVFNEISNLTEEVLSIKGTVKEKFTNLAVEMVEHFSVNQDLFSFMMTHVNKTSDQKAKIEMGHSFYNKKLADCIKSGINSGEIKKLNADDAVQLFNYMLYGYQMNCLNKESTVAFKKNGVKTLIEIFFNGISKNEKQ